MCSSVLTRVHINICHVCLHRGVRGSSVLVFASHLVLDSLLLSGAYSGSFQELSPPPTIGALVLQVYATPPGFIVNSRDPNSGLHALLANTFIHGTISLALQCMLLVKVLCYFYFKLERV